MNVNDQFSGFEAHTVYIAACSFVVLLIIPGIAFLYSGLARRKSALTLLFQSMATVAVCVLPIPDR
jgi:Amt family ammonium transporter